MKLEGCFNMNKQKTKFKQTEIGMIPEDWELIKLKNYLKISPRNGVYKGKEDQGKGIDIVKMGTLFSSFFIDDQDMEKFELDQKEKRIFLLEKDDLVFARTSLILEGVGKCAIVDTDSREIAFESNTFRIRLDNNKINPKYILYFFRSRVGRHFIDAIASQTAATSIKSSDLVNISLPIPKKSEQDKVAQVLYNLDKRIKILKQMNKTLEAIGQAIFKHWFVDFEFPNEEGNPYKSSGGEMVFNEELGKEIPKGWEVKRIGEVCKTFGGGTPNTNEQSYWDGGDIYWATPTDITALSSPIIFDTARKITQSGLEKSSAKMLPLGAVLMTSRATLGHFAISKVPIATNQGFISIVCGDYPSNYFMMYSVKQKIEQIIGFAGGSTYPEINKTAFRSIQIIIPPRELVRKFDKNVESLYNEIYENERENKTLALMRLSRN